MGDDWRFWLGDLDSNQDSQIQNLESYRWTISQPLGGSTNRSNSGSPGSYDSSLLI